MTEYSDKIDELTDIVQRIYSEYKHASVLKMCHMISVNVYHNKIAPVDHEIRKLQEELKKVYAEIADKEAIIDETKRLILSNDFISMYNAFNKLPPSDKYDVKKLIENRRPI